MEIRDHQMPHGVTKISIDFVRANHQKIGEIIAVKITQNKELDLKTYVIGTRGTIVTDGFTVGYGGEGPTGLQTVLRALEIKRDKEPSKVGLKDGESYVWYMDRPSVKMKACKQFKK